MSVFEIIVYVLSVVILVVGLLLSNSGSTGGLAALSGQDLEIFKKTKDRGLIKILQIVMFTLVFLLILAAVGYRIYLASIPPIAITPPTNAPAPTSAPLPVAPQ